tara:strand:- start:2617 stop:4329 length:1713 start_codon:yes stop_codon:yes gene_type:complete
MLPKAPNYLVVINSVPNDSLFFSHSCKNMEPNVVAGTAALSLFVPIIITIMSQYQKDVEADENTCGINAYHDGKECVCNPCYAFDMEGRCNECDPNCHRVTRNGKVYCMEQDPLDRGYSPEYDPTIQVSENTTEELEGRDFVPGKFAYDENAFPAGIYTDFENYQNTESTAMKDVIQANFDAAKNLENVFPYVWNGNDGSGGLINQGHFSRPFVDRLEREQVNEWPIEPQDTFRTGLDVSDLAMNLAVNNMGNKLNYVDSQLTSFADGDIMTGFKPISSVFRPTSNYISVMTNKFEEREVSRQPREDRIYHEKGPLLPEIHEGVGLKGSAKEKMNENTHTRKWQGGQEERRTPYPTTTQELINVPIYERSQLQVDSDKQTISPEYFMQGAPFREASGDDVRRSTAIRNKRELPHIHKMSDGFAGAFIDTYNDVALSKPFYEGFFENYDLSNGKGPMKTRDTDRLLVAPRGSSATHALTLRRDMSNSMRSTSNKVQNNIFGVQPRDSSYYTEEVQIAPHRMEDLSLGRGNGHDGGRLGTRYIEPLQPRTEELLSAPYAFSRDEIQAGPAER